MRARVVVLGGNFAGLTAANAPEAIDGLRENAHSITTIDGVLMRGGHVSLP